MRTPCSPCGKCGRRGELEVCRPSDGPAMRPACILLSTGDGPRSSAFRYGCVRLELDWRTLGIDARARARERAAGAFEYLFGVRVHFAEHLPGAARDHLMRLSVAAHGLPFLGHARAARLRLAGAGLRVGGGA